MGRPRITATRVIQLLADYGLGPLKSWRLFTAGTVQTNVYVETADARCVLRLYGNRAAASVRFELNLLAYLKKNGFPCPAPLKNRVGSMLGSSRGKPFALFEFAEGRHLERLNSRQREALYRAIGQLHALTRHYRPAHKAARWNYGPEFCRRQAVERAGRLGTPNARAKLAWYLEQVDRLVLPPALPKGICHTDFYPTNMLFAGDSLQALLDFDDANRTYLLFDLSWLIDFWAWGHGKPINPKKAREIVAGYQRYRPLNALERRHLFDVHKMQVLIDCLWFFERGRAGDFFERRKIEYLDGMGRERYGRLVGVG